MAGEELLSLIFEEIQGRERLYERSMRLLRRSAAAEECKLP
jgi:hypothetical protein